MLIDSKFRGRIFQTVEALDFGDAVSNQVIALDGMLRQMGFETAIFTQWHHHKVGHLRSDLVSLTPTDEDVVVLHYAGYSDHMLPYVQALRCTKICVYHNITPHEFFPPGSGLYDFCLKGRHQLREVVRDFHYFWGDSSYNLQELIDLGADAKRSAVLPIVVEAAANADAQPAPSREPGAWIFLGRVAGNKGQQRLVQLFSDVRAKSPEHAQKLYIVGNFSPSDEYYQQLVATIEELNLTDEVVVTGKVEDAAVQQYLALASIYVSLSEHEGFGVPLIEAAHHRLPVVALNNTAVGETMGNSPGLAGSMGDMAALIQRTQSDPDFRRALLDHQAANAERFSFTAVQQRLAGGLRAVLPDRFRFSTVSVVICTYNRSDLLDRCLDYLQHQTNQSFEVIVVNGPSTDNTEEIVEKYRHRIKYAKNPSRNLSVSRNMGIELADGDLVAFIDDDAIPFDDWVATLLAEFGARPLTHAAIGGPAYFSGTLKFQAQDIGINKFAVAKVNIESHQIGKKGWERSMLGTNTCFRADIVAEQRGFDEQFDYFLDESEISFRLQKNNYIVGYAPDLHLRHEFAQSANRVSQYNFNWFSICKNTAYFVAAYSGLQGAELREFLDKQAQIDRIEPMQRGVEAGVVSRKEFDSYLTAIDRGTTQGLIDAKDFPKTRAINPPPGRFQVFTAAAAHPLAGCDIKPLHVCILTKEFPPFVPGGGIGTLYYHLASELLLMGHHVTVLVPGKHKSTFRQGRLAICYQPVEDLCDTALGAVGFTNNTNWSLSAVTAITEIHAQHPIDVVDSASWDSEALALSLIPPSQRPPLVLRLVTPFPVASRINGWAFSDNEVSLFNTSEKKLIQSADAVVPISESIASTVEKEHGLARDSRWTRSYCGIAYWPSFDPWKNYNELKEINGQPLTFPEGARVVLFVGRLERRKGVDLLMKAASSFLAADSEAHLVLAGKDGGQWSTSGLDGMPEEVARRIHFLGEVDDATRDKLLHAAYCVVFPSRYESFGLVPLEAFVHGTPVIATRAGAIPEVVLDEDCGLLFEPEDAQSLARCVTRLLAEPQLQARLAAGAKRRVRLMSSRNSAIATVKLYASLVGYKAGSRGAAVERRRPRAVNGSTAQSFSYVGSHPRLRTQCGTRVGDEMRSTGKEGFLIHGPYENLMPGAYRAELLGDIREPGGKSPLMEVVMNSGQTLLASCLLDSQPTSSKIGSLEFTIETGGQVEVRVWIAEGSNVSIRELTFLRERDLAQ